MRQQPPRPRVRPHQGHPCGAQSWGPVRPGRREAKALERSLAPPSLGHQPPNPEPLKLMIRNSSPWMDSGVKTRNDPRCPELWRKTCRWVLTAGRWPCPRMPRHPPRKPPRPRRGPAGGAGLRAAAPPAASGCQRSARSAHGAERGLRRQPARPRHTASRRRPGHPATSDAGMFSASGPRAAGLGRPLAHSGTTRRRSTE